MPEGRDQKVSRRELLKRAGRGAAAIGVAGSGASKAFAFAGPHKHTGQWLSGNLSILQWVHFVPDYDTWFDKTWCKAVGREERRQRHRRPHREHAARRARGVRGCGAERSRHLRVPRAAGDLRGPGDQPQGHRRGGDQEGRPDEPAREAVDLQPEDEEVLRDLGQLRARPGRMAARPLERHRRGADDVGERAQGGAEAEERRPSDRHRHVERARLEHGEHRVHDVLRLVHPERGEPPDDQVEGHGGSSEVHGRDLQGAARPRRSSAGSPRRTTTSSTRAKAR